MSAPARTGAVSTQRPTLRVLVADDAPNYRQKMVSAVEGRSDLELVGETSTGRDTHEAVRRLQPDITLLDVTMPHLDLLGAVGRGEFPTRVVVVSSHLDGGTVRSAIAAGVEAYVSKAATPEQVCDLVAGMAGGDATLPPELELGPSGEIHPRSTGPPPLLSTREHQVLTLIADGMEPDEVCRRLYLSPETLRTNVMGFCEKLEVSEVPDAVLEGTRRGLIT